MATLQSRPTSRLVKHAHSRPLEVEIRNVWTSQNTHILPPSRRAGAIRQMSFCTTTLSSPLNCPPSLLTSPLEVVDDRPRRLVHFRQNGAWPVHQVRSGIEVPQPRQSCMAAVIPNMTPTLIHSFPPQACSANPSRSLISPHLPQPPPDRLPVMHACSHALRCGR